MKDTLACRQAVIDACRWLKDQGYVFGTWGNISVRLDGGNLLITPSRVAYETMVPEDLVVLGPDGTQLSGTRLSTSERGIHRRIMEKRPDVGAIVHMHSAYAMAACARDGGVPAISEEMCQLLGGGIPLTAAFVPSDQHEALGRMVADAVTASNAVLIRNHGPVCFGRDLPEALLCCQVVEKSCQMYLHLLAAGQLRPLEEPNISRGRDYFLHGYGKT